MRMAGRLRRPVRYMLRASGAVIDSRARIDRAARSHARCTEWA